ncbi:MAG TPA: hypothetical protein VIJ66_04280 [Solirubrobacteraceae bacterium]
MLSKAEQEGLKPILPYFKFDGTGVGGKPTVRIEGANLQVMSAGIPSPRRTRSGRAKAGT